MLQSASWILRPIELSDHSLLLEAFVGSFRPDGSQDEVLQDKLRLPWHFVVALLACWLWLVRKDIIWQYMTYVISTLLKLERRRVMMSENQVSVLASAQTCLCSLNMLWSVSLQCLSRDWNLDSCFCVFNVMFFTAPGKRRFCSRRTCQSCPSSQPGIRVFSFAADGWFFWTIYDDYIYICVWCRWI